MYSFYFYRNSMYVAAKLKYSCILSNHCLGKSKKVFYFHKDNKSKWRRDWTASEAKWLLHKPQSLHAQGTKTELNINSRCECFVFLLSIIVFSSIRALSHVKVHLPLFWEQQWLVGFGNESAALIMYGLCCPLLARLNNLHPEGYISVFHSDIFKVLWFWTINM